MPLAPTAADAALSSQLRISVMRLARRLRAQRADTAHSPSQVATLATLERHGPLTPGELAAHEKVRPPSMSRILGVLESDDLVLRTAHPTDGRQQLLSITRTGRSLLAADRRRREAWLARQLTDLTATELEALREVLPLLDRLAGA